MEEKDLKDLLLGRAIKYLLQVKGGESEYWKIIERIEYIVANNIQYESYNLDNMERDLYKYLVEKGEQENDR